MNEKLKAAFLSNISNITLTLLKLAVGLLINSTAILAEAVHSGMDLAASMIAYFSIKKAMVPPDKSHPYGHGKYENVSAILEAALIFLAACLIIYEAIVQIIHGVELKTVDFGILVMLVSAIVNWFVSAYLFRVAKKTDSPALDGDAWHLRTDVYTSLGIFISLIIVRITMWKILDPAIAILMGLYLGKLSIDIIRKSWGDILDESLPEEDEQKIKEVLDQYVDKFVEYHQLRTRKMGSERQIDLHLVFLKGTSLEEAHSLCDKVENELSGNLDNARILIHAEPCEHQANCDNKCSICRHLKDKEMKAQGSS